MNVWFNGVWFNGVWFNGVWFNGVWFNGVWFNSVWFNGAWFNSVWFNGVWFDGVRFSWYLTQNQNISQNLWPICKQSWHWWVLESIRLPLNHPSSLPFFLYACISPLCTKFSPASINYCNIVVMAILQTRPRWMHEREVMLTIIPDPPLTELQHPDTIEYRENSCVLLADIPHLEIHISPHSISNSSMTLCQTAVTHNMPTKSIEFCRFSMLHLFLCYAVTANAWTFTHNHYV